MSTPDRFAAIDWGGTFNQLCLVDDAGIEIVNQRFANDVAGSDALFGVLADNRQRLGGVAIERSEGIIVERLQQNNYAVFAVSPRVSARARERYQAAARKSDRFDAFVLADTLRTDGFRWRVLSVPTSQLLELRAVVRHRRQLLETQIAVEAQLRETLLAYQPGPIALFSSVDRDATLAFLRDYPTPEAASKVGEARMEWFCHRISYTGRVPPAVLVERLRANLLTASPGSINGHRYAALALADQLELLNKQLRAYNRQLGELFDAHPDSEIFSSFPAAGRVIGSELLAEIGDDRARYPTVDVLLCEAGIAPVTLASGKVHRVRIRYACNKRLRATTTTWAYTMKRIDPVSRERYLAALSRGQTQHRALRGVASTWTRILWRCWQDRVPFDPQRPRRTTT
jgi:transposase